MGMYTDLRKNTPVPISGDRANSSNSANFSLDGLRKGIFDAVSLYRQQFKKITDDTIGLSQSSFILHYRLCKLFRSDLDYLLARNVKALAPFLKEPREFDSSSELDPDTVELMINFYHIFNQSHMKIKKLLDEAKEKARNVILSSKTDSGEPKPNEIALNQSGQWVGSFHSDIVAACSLTDLSKFSLPLPKIDEEYLLAISSNSQDYLLIHANTQKGTKKSTLMQVFHRLLASDKRKSSERDSYDQTNMARFEILSICGKPHPPAQAQPSELPKIPVDKGPTKAKDGKAKDGLEDNNSLSNFEPETKYQSMVAEIPQQSSKSEPAVVFMLSDDGALRSAQIIGSQIQRADLLAINSNPISYSVGGAQKLHWAPQRLKLIPELGILSFLETPTRLLLIDLFRRYKDLKKASASTPDVLINSHILSSGDFAFSFELTFTLDQGWTDVFRESTLDSTQECKEPSQA